MTAPAGPQATGTTRTGKTHGPRHLAAALRAAGVLEVDDQDDVALADVSVLGVRLANLRLDSLEEGSPAWNACRTYQLGLTEPWAASHYETLARHWADCANALHDSVSGRGRGQ